MSRDFKEEYLKLRFCLLDNSALYFCLISAKEICSVTCVRRLCIHLVLLVCKKKLPMSYFHKILGVVSLMTGNNHLGFSWSETHMDEKHYYELDCATRWVSRKSELRYVCVFTSLNSSLLQRSFHHRHFKTELPPNDIIQMTFWLSQAALFIVHLPTHVSTCIFSLLCVWNWNLSTRMIQF